MRETKYWTWFMAAGVVILVLLGLHMIIMHVGSVGRIFSPHGGESTSLANSRSRDANPFFTVTYVLLLATALFHGLYGLRTIILELSPKPAAAKAVGLFLALLGLGLFGLGTWAALAAHAVAVHAAAAAGGGS